MTTADSAPLVPREAVAVFHEAGSMDAAVDELLSSGFNHGDLSILADEQVLSTKPGMCWMLSQQLADEPGAPTKAYVSPESLGDLEGAVIGVLTYLGAIGTAAVVIGGSGPIGAAILATAAAGAGGAGIGVLLTQVLRHHHADELAHQLERGGLLLWVRTATPAAEERAVSVLRRHGGQDVHVHDIVSEAVFRGRPAAPSTIG